MVTRKVLLVGILILIIAVAVTLYYYNTTITSDALPWWTKTVFVIIFLLILTRIILKIIASLYPMKDGEKKTASEMWEKVTKFANGKMPWRVLCGALTIAAAIPLLMWWYSLFDKDEQAENKQDQSQQKIAYELVPSIIYEADKPYPITLKSPESRIDFWPENIGEEFTISWYIRGTNQKTLDVLHKRVDERTLTGKKIWEDPKYKKIAGEYDVKFDRTIALMKQEFD